MRIVHIIDYFQPAIGYQETFLCKEQARIGHDIYVITSDRYSPLVYKDSKNLLGSRIKGFGFVEEAGIKVWRLKTLFEVSHAIWLRGVIKKLKEIAPDIVIIHGIVNITSLRVAFFKYSKSVNFKLIYDDHMTFENSLSKARIIYPLFKWTLANLIKKSANAFVAVGEPSKHFMNRRYGIPLDRVSIIPLGADTKIFHFDSKARQELRNIFSYHDE